MNKPLKVFITYAHKDTWAKDELIIHLAVLKREGLIDIWHDNEILPGDKWHDAIFSNLADSDILLYLTSAYSLDSENCNKELTAALKADTNIRVIPIIVDECDWENHQLSDFQALPDKGKAITDSSVWKRESEGWKNVVAGIRRVVPKMQVQAKPSPHITPEEIEILSELVFQQGNFLMMLKQMDGAIEAYSRAIELNSNHAASYNNRGVAYCEKGEHDLAIKDYNEALKFEHELASIYSNRGTTYAKKEEFDLAINDFTKAIEIDSAFAGGYYNRGRAYRDKGNFECAIKDYDEAIRLKPDHAEAYNNRGNALREKGEHDLAIEDYSRAIDLKPNFAIAYYNRGFVYHGAGEHHEAIRDSSKAVELNSEFFQGYLLRSTIYYDPGEYDEAIEDSNKAIQLNPASVDAYNNRGFAHLYKNEIDLAIADFSKIIELQPDNAVAYYIRAKGWFRLREWKKARANLTTARALGLDISAAFRLEHSSIVNFERITGIQLPEDIAAMLTPSS